MGDSCEKIQVFRKEPRLDFSLITTLLSAKDKFKKLAKKRSISKLPNLDNGLYAGQDYDEIKAE